MELPSKTALVLWQRTSWHLFLNKVGVPGTKHIWAGATDTGMYWTWEKIQRHSATRYLQKIQGCCWGARCVGREDGSRTRHLSRTGHLKNLNVKYLPFSLHELSSQAFVSLQIKSWITVTKLFFCHRKQNVKELKLTMLKDKCLKFLGFCVSTCSVLFVTEKLNSFCIRKAHSCIFICQKVSAIHLITSFDRLVLSICLILNSNVV